MAKTVKRQATNKGLITLDEASHRLGLTPDFLRWALDNDFLRGVNQNDGEWRLPGAEIDAGFDAIETELAARHRGETVAGGTAEGSGSPADAETPAETSLLPAGPDQDLKRPDDVAPGREASRRADGSRGQWQDRLDRIESQLANKDALIADLSRSLARLAEATLSRLPSHEEAEDA